MGTEVQVGMLDSVCSQAVFGQMVGIGQPAVSDLQARGVILPGDTAGEWLLAYCGHLRETAAGRDPTGELIRARVIGETAKNERLERQNAVERREYAPVNLLEVALGAVARQLATRLDAVVPLLRRRLPDMPSSALNIIGDELAACRDLLAEVNLDDAERIDAGDDEDGEDSPEPPTAHDLTTTIT